MADLSLPEVTVAFHLPEGRYPYLDQRLPLADLMLVEAPQEFESLIRSQAASNGISLIRDEPVELKCQMPDQTEAAFLVYWPSGEERMHILVPKNLIKGKA